MKKENTWMAVAIVVIGVFASYVIIDKNIERDSDDNKEIAEGMHMMPDGSMMHNADNNTHGMDHMVSMVVKSEQEFVEGMIPHHQEAVDTAKEVIARGGTTPEIKKLVQDIVVAQEKEIALMKVWYEEWYKKPYADNGKYDPMMRDLKSLSGKDLDKVFLEDMIMHHMGAIVMAKSVDPYIEHGEIAELAKNIISSQSLEIQQMQQMLKSL